MERFFLMLDKIRFGYYKTLKNVLYFISFQFILLKN
jgi:hypothetical protein